MLLFCSTMPFASGVFAWGICLGVSADFCGFLQVRRKTFQFVAGDSFVAQTFQFVAGDRYFFRKFSSNRTGRSQNCVSPE